jgi:non-homologous end joining protein Ku
MEPKAKRAPVIDLMEALQKSLKASGSGGKKTPFAKKFRRSAA